MTFSLFKITTSNERRDLEEGSNLNSYKKIEPVKYKKIFLFEDHKNKYLESRITGLWTGVERKEEEIPRDRVKGGSVHDD